jgi:hypothetical protein
MSTFVNRETLAARLEVSPSRVQQLTGAGVLTRHKQGYCLVESAIALAKYARRDEATKMARTRLICASAAISERRQRQALRQLVTLDEVQSTLSDLFGQLMGALRSGSGVIFAELAQEVGESKARSLTSVVYREVLGALLRHRDATERACSALEAGLHEGERLDEVVAELREAVSPTSQGGEDDED